MVARHVWVLGALVCAWGCDDADDDGGDAADAVVVVADAAVDVDAEPSGCAPGALEACAYAPALPLEPGGKATREVTYTDVGGSPRALEIEVRRPMAPPGPTPVVIWSHGGASGKRSAAAVGDGWGRVFVRAGYTMVAIAHTPRSRAEFDALCVGLEWADGCGGQDCDSPEDCTFDGAPGLCEHGGCRFWKHLSWDRPHDLRAVLDWLEAQAAPGGALEGAVDLSRVAYAGHSAGAGATMMVAGATRQIAGRDTLLGDPRPRAFISASPQGPGDDGFTEASFTGEGCRALGDPEACLTRPHLVLSGVGDDTSVVAENRRLAFDLAPPGDRHLFWITEEAARHTTFEYGTDACERHVADAGGDAARCATYLRWLRSVAVAFLDAQLRDDAAARAWLDSSDAAVLAEGAAEWVHR